MAKLSIKLNLQALNGAFLTNIKGKTATKKCLCIPVENLYVGAKGSYLDLTAMELKDSRYGDTHCIRQNFAKDVYERMSEEQKKSLPIIGNIHPLQAGQEISSFSESTDNLPF